jgi:putative transposase
MACPHCEPTRRVRQKATNTQGCKPFACRTCKLCFNERTSSPFNDLQFPTDIVLLAVLWRLRYMLGFRDVAELLLQHGFEVSHETIRIWEFRFAPVVAERLRTRRRGKAGRSMVPGRNVYQGQRSLVLPLSCDRPRRQPVGLDAQRTPR